MDIKYSLSNLYTKSKTKFQNCITKLSAITLRHRTAVDIGVAIGHSFVNFAMYKTPFAFVEGAFETFRAIGKSVGSPNDFFSTNHGWTEVDCNYLNLFVPAILKFSKKELDVYSDKMSIITLPVGEIGLCTNKWDGGIMMFFKPSEMTKDALFKFLVDELYKGLNSKVFSLMWTVEGEKSTPILVSENPKIIHSTRSKLYTDYITHCLSKDISRAIILHGLPGTGKSSIANSITNSLDFKTLKFKYSEDLFNDPFYLEVLISVIELFNVDAVIIDDFDQIENPSCLLEFLEKIRKNVKLVVAIANSLEEFHPAILRPGRFDEIILIDKLEKETIKNILGELYDTYGEKVKRWPVAYINELVNRNKIGVQNMNKAYLELNKRVNGQMKILSREKNE